MRQVNHVMDLVKSSTSYKVQDCKSPSFRNQGATNVIIDGKLKLAPGESVVLDTEENGYVAKRSYEIEFEKSNDPTNELLVITTVGHFSKEDPAATGSSC